MEIYVTVTCSYGGADMSIQYVGTDKDKAYSITTSSPENHHFASVETWVDGKKIKDEDI